MLLKLKTINAIEGHKDKIIINLSLVTRIFVCRPMQLEWWRIEMNFADGGDVTLYMKESETVKLEHAIDKRSRVCELEIIRSDQMRTIIEEHNKKNVQDSNIPTSFEDAILKLKALGVYNPGDEQLAL